MIKIRTASGFVLKPPPVKAPAVKRPRIIKPMQTFAEVPKISIADPQYSMDEKTRLIIEQIIEECAYIDDDETRDLWMDGVETFSKTGDIKALIDLTTYRRKVVPIDEFLFSKTYLGLSEEEIYPGVIEACHDLDSGDYVEAVLKGALGAGKSTIANIMIGRTIYTVSCMRHPQSTFGIMARSSMIITIQSVRISTARKAVFEEFGAYIKASPYFKNTYPFDPLITSMMLFREQRITVMPVAASGTGAISMNVIGGILDEMNFMQKVLKSKSQNADDQGSFDQAKQIYENISRRRKTRFMKRGKLPGILFLVSSSRFPNDFTEKKANESTMCGGTDPLIYVFSKAVWESKRRDQFLPETFRVMVGTAQVRSKILERDETSHPDCQVIDVPMDFYHEFRDDIEGSIRDLGGITTLSARPFITNRDAIFTAMKRGETTGFVNPFEHEQYDLSLGIPRPDRNKLRTDIRAFRAAHVDLGWRRDAAGISIGHISSQKISKRIDKEKGISFEQLMPEVTLDVVLRVVPPPNGEIEFAKIRQLLVMLRDDYDLPIEFVTFDGFESIDSRQILRSLGFKCDYLSVEKIEAYRSLRDAFYDERLVLPQHHFLATELAALEYVSTSRGEDKVDHPTTGTKDVADGVCGVVNFLLTRKVGWSGSFKKPTSHVGQTADQREQETDFDPRAALVNNMLPPDETAERLIRPSSVRRNGLRRSMVRR